MRLSGALDDGDTLARTDHVCWVCDDAASFTGAGQRFLAEGVARDEWLLCVGDGLADEFDEYIASGSGMVALCAYRRGALPGGALADVAPVHPQVHAPHDPPSFRIGFDGARPALAGTIDSFGADRLSQVLAGTPATEQVVAVDLSGLQVVDAAGARAPARWAGGLTDRETAVHLPGAPPSLVRIWSLLGLDRRARVDVAEPA